MIERLDWLIKQFDIKYVSKEKYKIVAALFFSKTNTIRV